MANPPLSPAQFLTALLGAVHELTGRRPPPTWTHVDKVQTKLGTDNRDAIDAAIRVAVARRWLRADGDPPVSITLTGDGVKLLEAAKPA
ncbi:MAG TPA: hypothetical protein VLA02_17860 [Reyranella sp.]|nr:hypothetical protein [Reyranella sp.]